MKSIKVQYKKPLAALCFLLAVVATDYGNAAIGYGFALGLAICGIIFARDVIRQGRPENQDDDE